MATYHFDTLAVNYVAESVLHVALNRPGKLNAMNSQFWDDLAACMRQASQDSDVRSIVLSGNGRAFSAGLDLMSVSPLQNSENKDAARKALDFVQGTRRLQQAISSVEKCWKPVIAAVHGMCIGGGVDLITACDIRFCSADASFCVKEVAIGLAADIGTLQRLPKVVGNGSLVRELALTGRNMYAAEAKDCGLVSTILTNREELINHAVKTASIIASHSPVGVVSTKANLNFSRDHSVDDGLEFVLAWNAGALQTGDMMKAAMAGMQKKTVKFSKL